MICAQQSSHTVTPSPVASQNYNVRKRRHHLEIPSKTYHVSFSECKPDISKSVVTAMRSTIDDKHFIKWMRVKKLRRKKLAQDVFDGRRCLDEVKTLIKT